MSRNKKGSASKKNLNKLHDTDFSCSEQDKLLFDYHKHNNVYLVDQTKFADAKTTLAIGANLVMLGFFGAELKNTIELISSLIENKKFDFTNLPIANVGLMVGVLLLSLATYFFIWKVLWPRYHTDTEFYLSWGGIGSMKSSKLYVNHIGSIPIEKLAQDLAHQNYSLALVCLKKYKNLKYGFMSLTAGAIISSISWLFLLE